VPHRAVHRGFCRLAPEAHRRTGWRTTRRGVRCRYDQRRTRALEARGFKVLRFWNHECLAETERVLEEIDRCLRENGRLPS
jgi:G:T-mismatch repair DNA endonuclease (very short patch repair protein)